MPTMNDVVPLAGAGLAGLLLGAFFFGGLWWGLRRGMASARPELWQLGSVLLRTGGALAGFYAVGQGRWPLLVACLVGFVAARLAAIRLMGDTPARGAASDLPGA